MFLIFAILFVLENSLDPAHAGAVELAVVLPLIPANVMGGGVAHADITSPAL